MNSDGIAIERSGLWRAVDGSHSDQVIFLVGQIMKATKGQANPQAAQAALESELATFAK